MSRFLKYFKKMETETKKKISYNTKAWMKEHKKEFKLALKP